MYISRYVHNWAKIGKTKNFVAASKRLSADVKIRFVGDLPTVIIK